MLIRELQKKINKRALLLVIFFHIISLILVLERTLRHSKQILISLMYQLWLLLELFVTFRRGKTLVIYVYLKRLVKVIKDVF